MPNTLTHLGIQTLVTRLATRSLTGRHAPQSGSVVPTDLLWIWLGCVVMALGGLIATLDRRYRVVTRRREAPVAASPSRREAATGNSSA